MPMARPVIIMHTTMSYILLPSSNSVNCPMFPQVLHGIVTVNLQLYHAVSQKRFKLAPVTIECEHEVTCDLSNSHFQ